MIRIFIIEDHQLLIDGLKALISLNDDMEVVGEALSGEDGIRMLKDVEVDVLICDINLPGIKGNEIAHLVKKEYPKTNILVLSMYDDVAHVAMMVQAGAMGYLLKNTSKGELDEAIRSLHAGVYFYTPKIREKILDSFASASNIFQEANTKSTNPTIELSTREIDIISLIINGLNNYKIAELLNLSIHTVKSHRKSIYHKLNVSNTAALIQVAIDNQVIDHPLS